MITAKAACECTHANRNKVMDKVKSRIEAAVLQCLEGGGFSAEVFYEQVMDEAYQEEIFDYLSGLGYDIVHSNSQCVKFSWLVD